MRTRIVVLGLALAAGLPLTAGCAGTPRAPGSTPAGALRLASYDTCDDLLADFRRAAGRYVTPYGLANPAYARDVVAPDAAERAPGAQPDAAGKDVEGSAAPAHSDTNNQETGVAEPDLVKTDGKRIVTVSGGTLRVVDAARRTELGHLDLGDGAVGDARMLLAGDRVLVISQSTGVVADGATAAAPPGGPVRKDPVGQD
ncbi:MAG: beta-propeller domain-containing protein, partial [Actinocatenispora sp.]